MHVTLEHVDAIPKGEGRAFVIGERKLAVFHTRSGEVYATQAHCPHKDGPIFDGLVGGCTVICPLHGKKFDLDSGLSTEPEFALATYPVTIDEDGRVIVELEG
jgi:nitrite reductase (NADH) small subunit